MMANSYLFPFAAVGQFGERASERVRSLLRASLRRPLTHIGNIFITACSSDNVRSLASSNISLPPSTTELVTSPPNKARVSCKFYVAVPEIFYWQRRRLRRRPQLNLFAKCQAFHSTDMLCQDYYDGLGRPCLQLSWRWVDSSKRTLLSRSMRNLIPKSRRPV